MTKKNKEEFPFVNFTKGYKQVIKRDGYYGFVSLVWWLFKTNRKLKHQKADMEYKLILPVKHWFK